MKTRILLCSCCFFIAPIFGRCSGINDPIFRYRCAEYAYKAREYPIAEKFYSEILSHCHASSHLSLLCINGLLDSMLAGGEWSAADTLITQYDFTTFQHLFGYDSLLLRECFLLIKNKHFNAAKNLLFSTDFLTMNTTELGWYHCLYALILSHQRNFHSASVEFEVARNYCSSAEQLSTIEAFRLQCEIDNLGLDSDIDQLARSLKEKIDQYGPLALPFFKQYILLCTSTNRCENIPNHLFDDMLEHVATEEEVYQILLYQAIYSGISSECGKRNLYTLLLRSKNRDTQLLALKLITCTMLKEDEVADMLSLLDSVFKHSPDNWIQRQVLLGELAIALKHNVHHTCQEVANRYVNTFEHDKYFAEIYELLAYLAVGVPDEANEYRVSVHYLDKVRSAAPDVTTKLAITLQIADAFFNNQDFKLASEMYSEVLALDESKKFQYVIENQVISDLAQQDFEGAKRHLDAIDHFSQEKCAATFLFIKALKKARLITEGIDYIDSIDGQHISKFFRLRLHLYKARLLVRNNQFSQAAMWATRVLDVLDKDNSKMAYSLRGHALFIKGCCALKLRDYQQANKFFEKLYKDFKDSKYTSLAILKEAEYWQEMGDNQRALELLKRCQDERYLAYTRYKIAELLRTIGEISDALKMFDLIIRENGQTELALLARIAQGDTLLSVGQFADADTIYDRVLSEAHEDNFLRYTSLARARCALAQYGKKPGLLNYALTELDKLYSSHYSALEWHLEVAAEYCLALKLKNNHEQLQTVALDSLKLLPEEQSQLNKKMIYWAVQILYFLRDNFESVSIHPWTLEAIEESIIKYQKFLQNE